MWINSFVGVLHVTVSTTQSSDHSWSIVSKSIVKFSVKCRRESQSESFQLSDRVMVRGSPRAKVRFCRLSQRNVEQVSREWFVLSVDLPVGRSVCRSLGLSVGRMTVRQGQSPFDGISIFRSTNPRVSVKSPPSSPVAVNFSRRPRPSPSSVASQRTSTS